jgi:hypothetical protein
MGDPMAEAPDFLAVNRDGTEKQSSRSRTHSLKKVKRAFEEMVDRDMDRETCRMIQAKSPYRDVPNGKVLGGGPFFDPLPK